MLPALVGLMLPSEDEAIRNEMLGMVRIALARFQERQVMAAPTVRTLTALACQHLMECGHMHHLIELLVLLSDVASDDDITLVLTTLVALLEKHAAVIQLDDEWSESKCVQHLSKLQLDDALHPPHAHWPNTAQQLSTDTAVEASALADKEDRTDSQESQESVLYIINLGM